MKKKANFFTKVSVCKFLIFFFTALKTNQFFKFNFYKHVTASVTLLLNGKINLFPWFLKNSIFLILAVVDQFEGKKSVLMSGINTGIRCFCKLQQVKYSDSLNHFSNLKHLIRNVIYWLSFSDVHFILITHHTQQRWISTK